LHAQRFGFPPVTPGIVDTMSRGVYVSARRLGRVHDEYLEDAGRVEGQLSPVRSR